VAELRFFFTLGATSRVVFSRYQIEIKRSGSMRKSLAIAALVAAAAGSSIAVAQQPDSMKVTIMNPTKDDWKNMPAVVPSKNGEGFSTVVVDGQKTLFVQQDDFDEDGKIEDMIFPVDLKAGESKTYVLLNEPKSPEPASRVHAGMFTEEPKRRGFEGPGWESDQVAFRMYWNEQAAIDVFGKTSPTLSLENLARTDVDYHKMTPWGMDVLQVGKSLGVGGFGAMIDGKVEKVTSASRSFLVRADGPYRAVCDLVFMNWNAGNREFVLVVRMKIYAGQDWADAEYTLAATDGKPLPEIVCGFAKQTTDTQLIKDDKVAMVGSWGKQALGEGQKPGDANLGMAVMASAARVDRIAEDDVNHLLVLKPTKSMRYRYLVDWDKDSAPTASAQEFEKLMRRTAAFKPIVGFVE